MPEVHPLPGDCLCLIARRHGLQDCTQLAALAEDPGLWDRALSADDALQVPETEEFSAQVATAGRAIVQVERPREAIAVRFVRPRVTAPADADAVTRLGISRYPTLYTSYSYEQNQARAWVSDAHRDFDPEADHDPNCFAVEVVDPNADGDDLSVTLEALRPDGHGGHVRFPGALRAARSLAVTVSRMGVARDPTRHRSCYLRLVVDEADRGRRPRQTLLVTDMVDEGDPGLEILDQDVVVRYEYPACPRPPGSRCLLGAATADMARGERVDLRVFVLRAQASGRPPTDEAGCVVPFAAVRRRVLKNTRRIWAQDGITFAAHIEAMDPPGDILAVSDPEGEDCRADGQISFSFTFAAYTWGAMLNNGTWTVTMPMTAGSTPLQTAQAIAAQMRGLDIAGLTVEAVANRPRLGAAGGGADVVPRCAWGRLRFTELTLEAFQDPAQKIRRVVCDPARFEIRSDVKDIQIGSGMQRMTYRAAATDRAVINVFVAGGLVGATAQTINSNADLPPACRPEPGMENCVAIPAECMSADLDHKPATLAHEIGHALMDHAEHPYDVDTSGGAVMTRATSETFTGGDSFADYQTKRVPAIAIGWFFLAEAGWGARQPGWQDRGWGVIGVVANYHVSLSDRVHANNIIVRAPR